MRELLRVYACVLLCDPCIVPRFKLHLLFPTPPAAQAADPSILKALSDPNLVATVFAPTGAQAGCLLLRAPTVSRRPPPSTAPSAHRDQWRFPAHTPADKAFKRLLKALHMSKEDLFKNKKL